MVNTFAAQVADFADDTERVHTAIFRESVQRVIEEMLKPRAKGGNMPVVTGFLRASLVMSKSEMPAMRDGAVPTEGATYTEDDSVILVIAGADLGDTLYAGFVAAYARAQNYGFGSHRGYLFLEMAAQKWQEIVSAVEAEYIRRAGLG